MDNIILGVTGSVAAYKAVDLASKLKKDKINVRPIMSKSSTKFITPLLMQSVSGNKVHIDLFDDEVGEISHIKISRDVKLILIAPCSANTIAKLSCGLCDDMLSATVLAAKNDVKVIVAPAMNEEMYKDSITQQNISNLKERGFIFIDPRIDLLACNEVGIGALAEIDDIIKVVKDNL